MRKLIMAVFAMALVALSFVIVAPAANAGSDKVGICHATGNGKYVPLEVSKDGTANGHAGHQNGRDIIPAFSWVEKKVRYYFDGQNLDMSALLLNGCKAPAENVTASYNPPTYVPASCMRPNLPYGEVVIPADKGKGVGGSSDPKLNADNTVWSASYTLTEPTEDVVYSWPAGFDGSFSFKVVPITEDPFWEIDSKTGEGSCVLPDTGASTNYLLIAGGAAALIAGGAFVATRRKKD